MSGLVATVSTTDNEEKQLSSQQDKVKATPLATATTEEEASTLEVADKYFAMSVDCLKQNELSEAIDNASQAVSIGEAAMDDVNDIKLAKYFLQYGKALLCQMQQTKELLVDDGTDMDTEADGKDADNENKTTETDDKSEESGTMHDTTNKGENPKTKTAAATDNELKTEDKTQAKSADTDKDTKTETSEKDGKKATAGNGKEEIEDGEDAGADNADTVVVDADADEAPKEECEDEEEYDARAVCWESLDTARFLIQNHLEKLGVSFAGEATHEEQEEEKEKKEDLDTANGDASATAAAEAASESDAAAATEAKKNSPVNEDPAEEEEDIDVTAASDGGTATEATEDADAGKDGTEEEEDANEELKYSYLRQLADVHSLCGDHQLEDNAFAAAISSYEESLQLKMDCEEGNRELAYSHFMIALAAGHAQEYESMEKHCFEALDLLNDRILTLIDSFADKKYLDKTSDEELDEEGLVALVKEFQAEYNGKVDSLDADGKEKLQEIRDLLVMMKDINDKLESELVDARKIQELEEEQGESIKDLVRKILANSLQGEEAGNGNGNNNVNVDGIEFGSGNTDNNNGGSNGSDDGASGSGKTNDENSNGNVNVMAVVSKSALKSGDGKQGVTTVAVHSTKQSRKRNLEVTGIADDDESPIKRLRTMAKNKANAEGE